MSPQSHDYELPGQDEHPPRGVRSMAVLRWGLVAFMGLLAAGSLLYYAGLSPGRSTSGPVAAARVYYCPMHPQIVQDRPGECPICGMSLVLRPEGAKPAAAKSASSPGADAAPGVPGLAPVDIPLDRVQRSGIRTAAVGRHELARDFDTVGVVEASERGLAQISPRVSGWIEQLFVSETGQRVKRGQPLATLYSPELLQAQQELISALAWNKDSPSGLPHHSELGSPAGLVADARNRLELLGISPTEIDALVASRKLQRALPLRSPVDGHVIAKRAVVGMNVTPGLPLFEVADLSTVWVVADVYEADLPGVRVGQTARFAAAAYPGEVFTGKVQFIYPTVDPGSRTLRVRLEFRNRPGPGGLKLRPGMSGNIALDLPRQSGLMVDNEAVIDTGDHQYVFVVKQGGRFEPRPVKLGARGDRLSEVTEGLSEGEVVVTTANFLIDSESRLRAAIEGQGARPGEAKPAAPGEGPECDGQFDRSRYPDKYQACRACEVQHRGMGTMVEDCKRAIAKPWR